MMALRLKGYITEDGQLNVELPEHHPTGEVTVTIETPHTEGTSWEERPWTDEELDQMLQSKPIPAKDIVAGGWEALNITDRQAWVEEQRRKDHGWQTPH